MGIIDIASSKSVWRGMDYHKQKKVLSYEENDDGTYEGDVAGSDNKKYHVHLDMIHPRKSKCNCPLANGKQIICKHIVAMSFCVDASEAQIALRMRKPYMHQRKKSAGQSGMIVI